MGEVARADGGARGAGHLRAGGVCWEPPAQQAARLQGARAQEEAKTALAEVLRWRDSAAREAAEASATAHGNGFFDFEDLPEAPRAAIEACRPGGCVGRGLCQIQAAVEEELTGIASAPHPPRTQLQALEWGKMLCTLQKEHPATLAEMLARAEHPEAAQPARPPVHVEEAEALEILRRRADVNVKLGDLKRRPLHTATERGYPRLVAALLEARADPNAADFAGEVPLHVAAHSLGWCQALPRDRRLTVAHLVGSRADVNFRNPRGRTPLHIAVAAADGDVMRALIAEGAEVDAQDLGGFTPLMWAAGRGRSGEVEALLDAAADPRLQAGRGQSAALFALTSGHCLVLSFLEERLALADKPAPEQRELLDEAQAVEVPAAAVAVAVEALRDPASGRSCEEMRRLPYMGHVRADCVPDLSSNAY